jgi:hypothetical protein
VYLLQPRYPIKAGRMVNAKKIHPRGLLAFPEVVKEARPKPLRPRAATLRSGKRAKTEPACRSAELNYLLFPASAGREFAEEGKN